MQKCTGIKSYNCIDLQILSDCFIPKDQNKVYINKI